MDYKTKSGYILTEEMLERLGDACEKGQYPGSPGAFAVAPVGRPPLYPNEDLVTIAFKIPRSQREKIDKMAAQKEITRSELMRDVLSEVLL